MVHPIGESVLTFILLPLGFFVAFDRKSGRRNACFTIYFVDTVVTTVLLKYTLNSNKRRQAFNDSAPFLNLRKECCVQPNEKRERPFDLSNARSVSSREANAIPANLKCGGFYVAFDRTKATKEKVRSVLRRFCAQKRQALFTLSQIKAQIKLIHKHS